jgi:hypothetical protein
MLYILSFLRLYPQQRGSERDADTGGFLQRRYVFRGTELDVRLILYLLIFL